MKTFISRFLLFSIPVLLLLIPPIFILKITGESFTDVDPILEKKMKFLIGYAYSEDNYKYIKWKQLQLAPRHSVLALGSSRILQLRENMFQRDFFNGGYTISSISDFVPFLKSIPENKYPELLIVNLDQWMFNRNWDAMTAINTDSSRWEKSFTKYPTGTILHKVWIDLLHGKYKADSFSLRSGDRKKVGLNAFVNNKGFRIDGSLYYGHEIDQLLANDTTREDFKFKDTFLRMKKGVRRFEYGDQTNETAFVELDRFLSFCKKKNIYVVGFLPPFADGVNAQIESSGNYKYMKEVYPRSKTVFNKFGFELWDMSSLQTCQSNDNEVIDGFHGSEVTYTKMLLYMIEHGSGLSQYANVEKLRQNMNHKINRFTIYPY